MDQIYRYYDVLLKEKRKDLRTSAMIQAQATAVAFGSVKGGVFDDFLEAICPSDKRTPEESLNEMKRMGLPVEDA